MSYRPQYYDSNIYMQSTNLILKAADLYYNQGMRQQEISEQLEISVSTVSRLLKKAKEQEIGSLHHRPEISGMPDAGGSALPALRPARSHRCADPGRERGAAAGRKEEDRRARGRALFTARRE